MNPVYSAAYGIEIYNYILIAAKSEMEAYELAREYADYVDFDSIKRIDGIVTHYEHCVIEEV